ncbi:MAG: hypothetical protein J2O48_02685 [Solirubrobacterales bacterium]|nr:hypothetical protein [Solirubrobacterales bacterium]
MSVRRALGSLGSEAGQDLVEYVGLIAVVAILIGGVLSIAPGLGRTIGHGIGCLVENLIDQNASCSVLSAPKPVLTPAEQQRDRAQAEAIATAQWVLSRTSDRKVAAALHADALHNPGPLGALLGRAATPTYVAALREEYQHKVQAVDSFNSLLAVMPLSTWEQIAGDPSLLQTTLGRPVTAEDFAVIEAADNTDSRKVSEANAEVRRVVQRMSAKVGRARLASTLGRALNDPTRMRALLGHSPTSEDIAALTQQYESNSDGTAGMVAVPTGIGAVAAGPARLAGGVARLAGAGARSVAAGAAAGVTGLASAAGSLTGTAGRMAGRAAGESGQPKLNPGKPQWKYNAENGALAEQRGFAESVGRGEIPLRRPTGVNENGPDWITYDRRLGRINVYDAKFSARGRWPSSIPEATQQRWLSDVADAVQSYSGPGAANIKRAFTNRDINWRIYRAP